MVKIRRADLDPKSFSHTLKGFYLRETKDGVAVCKSPSFGARNNRNSVWWRNQFAIAARMAASPIALDQISAMQVSPGTEQVPRDILMMAAYGNLVSVVLPDGTESTVADHGPPPELPPPEKKTMLVASFYDTAFTQAASSQNGATKGSTFRCLTHVHIHHIGIVYQPFAGSDIRLTLCRLDASYTITEILKTAAWENVTNDLKLYSMPVDLSFSDGEELTLLMTRTDSTNEYVLSLRRGTPAHWLGPFEAVRTLRLSTNNPQVATTLLPLTDGEVNGIAIEMERL